MIENTYTVMHNSFVYILSWYQKFLKPQVVYFLGLLIVK